MKRIQKSLLVVIALILMIITVNSSIAYFTSREKSDNVFTVGEISIRLDEPSWDPSEEHIITPSVSYDKDPIVTNDGKNDAYVRIVLTVTDYGVFKKYGGSNYDPSSMFNFGSKWVLTKEGNVKNDSITYVYTYTEVLAVNDKTQPLFTKVKMPDFMNGTVTEEMGGEFDVVVKADAIQAESFSNYTEAFSAFESQTGGN